MRVLVVEDEVFLAEMIAEGLRRDCASCSSVRTTYSSSTAIFLACTATTCAAASSSSGC
jgi:DNA-binding response OmpR family regulator